nr:hypothetical protein [Tanacetum cinerariifolium]
MVRHKEMYIISSHTKKIFANMRRIGIGFYGVITPLFDTIMVQAPADMGDTPVETHQTPIVNQPSTSKPQKKQKPKRKQRKEVEVSNDESEDEDHVLIPSSDPLPSGKDRFILNELMIFCTSLQEQQEMSTTIPTAAITVTTVVPTPRAKEATKTSQAYEIDSLKSRVKKLKKKQRSRTHKLKRIYMVRLPARVESSKEEGLVSVAATNVTIDDITLAKALEDLKTSKPKIRSIVIKDHEETSESRTTTTISSKKSQDKEEQQELNEEEKAKLFMELLEKRRKFFAAKRAEEKRNRPPTKAQ